jgi:hypothetical protein
MILVEFIKPGVMQDILKFDNVELAFTKNQANTYEKHKFY